MSHLSMVKLIFHGGFISVLAHLITFDEYLSREPKNLQHKNLNTSLIVIKFFFIKIFLPFVWSTRKWHVPRSFGIHQIWLGIVYLLWPIYIKFEETLKCKRAPNFQLLQKKILSTFMPWNFLLESQILILGMFHSCSKPYCNLIICFPFNKSWLPLCATSNPNLWEKNLLLNLD